MSYFIMAQDGSNFAAFDLLEAETHSDTCLVTQHNIEAGSPIADHVILEQPTLSLVLGVSNTPLDKDPEQERGGPIQVPLRTFTYRPKGNAITFPLPAPVGFGIVQGAPSAIIEESVNAQAFGFVDEFDRITETEQKLDEMRKAKSLLQVVTLSRDYIDMVMVRSELQRTRHGDARFSIDLVQIRFVRSATTSAPVPLEPKGAPKSKKGQQAAKSPFDLGGLLGDDSILLSIVPGLKK